MPWSLPFRQSVTKPPSPIQAATIPAAARTAADLLGQAQTGTGKTAAFALPILSPIDTSKDRAPQALVLAPTRELAIQVAEAFQKYAAASMPGFHVLPIYGGQSYGPQLQGFEARRARRRRHAGPRDRPPGARHAARSSSCSPWCSTKPTRCCAWASSTTSNAVLQKTPADTQVALFSATMPPSIRRIAQTHLQESGRGQRSRRKTGDRAEHPPALLDGQRPAQARRAHAHPRSRAASTP